MFKQHTLLHSEVSLSRTVSALAVLALATNAQPAWAASSFVMPANVEALTILQILHLAGLIVGGGGILIVDMALLRRLYHEPVDQSVCDFVESGSRFVTAGFVLLWLTGLGFLAHYMLFYPEKLVNPKLWAKLTIVSLMTLNAIVIHEIALPALRRHIGRPLLAGLPLSAALPWLVVAILSSTGWIAAFLLGKLRELNNVVPGLSLLSFFGLFVAACLTTAAFAHLMCAGTGHQKNRQQPASNAVSLEELLRRRRGLNDRFRA